MASLGKPLSSALSAAVRLSLDLGSGVCVVLLCQRCLNSLSQLEWKPHWILHQHWCIFPVILLPDGNNSSHFSSCPALPSSPSNEREKDQWLCFFRTIFLTTAWKWHRAELYLPWNNNVYKQSNAVVLQPPSLVLEISYSHLNYSSSIIRRALEKCQQKPGALVLPSISKNISTFK